MKERREGEREGIAKAVVGALVVGSWIQLSGKE